MNSYTQVNFTLLTTIIFIMMGLSACEDDSSVKPGHGDDPSAMSDTFLPILDDSSSSNPIRDAMLESDQFISPDMGPTQSEWQEIDLQQWGLDVPTLQDIADTPLPEGEDLCVLEIPEFAMKHPFEINARPPVETKHSAIPSRYDLPVESVDHPTPQLYRDLYPEEARTILQQQIDKNEELVLPGHIDDMPLFERTQSWTEARCYLLNEEDGGQLLSESQAYDMYKRLVSYTLWRTLDESPHRRNVIGLRGAYPGTLQWHHNAANQFNDTLVLLWKDDQGNPHVREFPVNTDTGEHDFGVNSSSSLRPNRHYPYVNGWHRGYHALQMDLPAYPVKDDTNNNGHWDSDRNGWLMGPQPGDDYDRLGNAHNIHGGEIDGPLEDALVMDSSAGCQVIPGSANWLSFITQAWTELGDDVDYYLIDARDIDPRFFNPCEASDGSHDCPYNVDRFPYQHVGNTALSMEYRFDRYNCDDAHEGGAEQVYILNVATRGILRAQIESSNEMQVDPDIHLLQGDDAYACVNRGHRELTQELVPGRYVIIVDTWVNDEGIALAGEYELSLQWSSLE